MSNTQASMGLIYLSAPVLLMSLLEQLLSATSNYENVAEQLVSVPGQLVSLREQLVSATGQ